MGSLALQFAPSIWAAFALVALWLLALGAAATVGTGGISRNTRTIAIAGAGALTALGLGWSVRGGGQEAVLLSLLSWAALTALASGVVRSLRLMRAALPEPPVMSAALGALTAGLALGDPGDVAGLASRLAVFVLVLAAALMALPYRVPERARAMGCRAGLFDCSLPAWPSGAWRDLAQWPVLLANLAMLPMMAALPLMATWCRAQSLSAQTLVMVHLAAMFGSALICRPWIERWSSSALALLCMLLLLAGAALGVGLPLPWDMVALAVLHGSAWGLAWSGQLWGPTRRAQQNASPWRASVGYAGLTLLFGIAVNNLGASGVTLVHLLIGLMALIAWLLKPRAGQNL